MKMPKDNKTGAASRSSFFKKGGEQGFFGKSGVIQKKAETDSIVGYTGNYIFQPGAGGLDRSFFLKVKRAVADGTLSDREIAALRKDAIDRNGTVEHAELLLMAAMRNPTNVTAMQAFTSGRLIIAMSDIRKTDQDYLNNFGREQMPIDTLAYAGRAAAAATGLTGETLTDVLNEFDAKANKQIYQYAGKQFVDQADDLINAAEADPPIPKADILNAMLNGAADSTPGDRIMAGTVYAIARRAGHPMAAKILDGTLQVDALIPSVYARVVAAGDAAYVPFTDADVMKADTLYIKTDLDIKDLKSRALVIHELTHAADDMSVSGNRGADSLTLETHAYKEQGKYMMDQILSLGLASATTEIASAAGYVNSGPLYYWSMVAGAKDNRTKYADALVKINTTAPMSKTEGAVRADLAKSASELDRAVRRELLAYRDASGQQLYHAGRTNQDGPAGHYFHQ